jgi:hypothetical protein
MQSTNNTFSRLNTDMHPLATKNDTYTYALNAALTTRGENQLILQNFLGTHKKASLTPGFRFLGGKTFNEISYIISGKFDASGKFLQGEIGTYPSPDWSNILADDTAYFPLIEAYQPLYNFSNAPEGSSNLNNDNFYTEPLRTHKFEFLNDRLIEVEVQPAYDDSVNIILTDWHNPIRLINSRFKLDKNTRLAALAKRSQAKNTNTYSAARFDATRLFKQSTKIVDLNLLAVEEGGFHSAGTQHFYFRYVDADGALTDVIEQSGPIVFANTNMGLLSSEKTNKLVRFRLSNLDRNFSGIKIYFTRNGSDEIETNQAFEILHTYPFTEDSTDITIFGAENTTVYDSTKLSLEYSSIYTARTMTQADDSLILANIKPAELDYELLKSKTLSVQITESDAPMTLEDGYSNPFNVYDKLGVWSGETYEVALVYVQKGGKGLTVAFPVRGGDNYNNDLVYTGASNFGVDGFLPNSTENALGVYRTYKCRNNNYYNASNPADVNNPDTVSVRYLNLDLTSLKNDPYILSNTDGFFVVRKERKKDCLVQGFITKAARETINNGLLNSGNSEQLQTLYPAPLGYIETPEGATFKEKEEPNKKEFAFYAPDMLADPGSFVNFFDNNQKAFLCDARPTQAYEDLGAVSNPVPGSFTITFKEFKTATLAAAIVINNKTYTYEISALSKNLFFTPTTTPGEFSATMKLALTEYIIEGINIQTNQLVFNADFKKLTTSVDLITWEETENDKLKVGKGLFSGVFSVGMILQGVFPTPLKFFSKTINLEMTPDSGLSNTFSVDALIHSNLNIGISSDTDIYKGANKLRSFNFCPTALLTPRTAYIGGLIQPLAHEQWSTYLEFPKFTAFEDYVGLKFTQNPTTLISALNESVGQNPIPLTDFYNYPRDNYSSATNFPLADFVYKLQIEGYNFGVMANVYDKTSGALTQVEWKVKYGSNVIDEPYYAVSKRYRWVNAQNILPVFRGDCFISLTYKRYSRGYFPGPPTATNPLAYPDALGGFGLKPRGYAFAMVTECNYNLALRCEREDDKLETALFGRKRTFWPNYPSKEALRSSRQPESKAYNFGYHISLSEKRHLGLNRFNPVNSVAYSNRIFISSPAAVTEFRNGYSDFYGFNFKDYHRQLGQIVRILAVDNYVYTVFEQGVGVLPLNRQAMFSTGAGDIVVDAAERLQEKMPVISSEFGSTQQFSVLRSDNLIYGVDLNKNRIWQVGGKELKVISDFKVQKIVNLFKQRLINSPFPSYIITNYDRELNFVYFSFLSRDKHTYNSDLYNLDDNFEDIVIPDDPEVIEDNTGVVIDKPLDENLVLTSTINPSLIPQQFQAQEKRLTKFEDTATIYFNETLNEWGSLLDWSPLGMFNIENKCFSFDAHKTDNFIWRYYSTQVPSTHIFGKQRKFIFEFVVVENSTIQKIIDNLKIISNDVLPIKIMFSVLEDDRNPDNSSLISNARHTALIRQRMEIIPFSTIGSNVVNTWATQTAFFNGLAYCTIIGSNGDRLTFDDAARLEHAFVKVDGQTFILGTVLEDNGTFYNAVLDQNGINVQGSLPVTWSFNTIYYTRYAQNASYVEDHAYIEVGRTNSHVRDKAIKVRIEYDGRNYTTVQAVISLIDFSFN